MRCPAVLNVLFWDQVKADMEGIQESLLDDAVVKHNISKALNDIEGEREDTTHPSDLHLTCIRHLSDTHIVRLVCLVY